MIPLFLGLTASNITLLCTVFAMGLSAVDAQGHATAGYAQHVTMGIAAGFMATGTHVVVYTYFMATTRWLQAATDKAGVDEARFATAALKRKKQSLRVVITALAATMAAMFTGGAGDPTGPAGLPTGLHLAVAAATVAVNAIAAWAEFSLIRHQGSAMDEALAMLNEPNAHATGPVQTGPAGAER